MRLFQEAILSTNGMTAEAAALFMYGEYLRHGGRREDFMDLTGEDIQLMYSATEARTMRRNAEAMAAIAGKELREAY